MAIYYLAEVLLILTNVFSLILYLKYGLDISVNLFKINASMYSVSFVGLYVYLYIMILVKIPQKRIKLAFIVLFSGMYIDFVIEYFSIYWLVGITCIYFAFMLLVMF